MDHPKDYALFGLGLQGNMIQLHRSKVCSSFIPIFLLGWWLNNSATMRYITFVLLNMVPISSNGPDLYRKKSKFCSPSQLNTAVDG